MTFRTYTYGLEAHLRGEAYSASVDRRRFAIIDNQLAFMSDIIGDGRILGLDISVEDAPSFELKISSGTAIVDRFVTQTFGDINFFVSDNKTSYAYYRRKQGILGGFGGYSGVGSVVYSDAVAPAAVTGLAYTSSTRDSVSFSWNANSEVDLDYYNVYRSLNNIDFSKVGTSESESYSDTDLSENTLYYYKVSAVDMTGNESPLSASLSVQTPKDLRVPLPPSGLFAIPGNETIQLSWERSTFGNLDRYEIHYAPVSSNNTPTSSPTVITLSPTRNYAVIKDLQNRQKYQFTVYAVSENDIYSTGITEYESPVYNTGPPEVDSLNVAFSAGVNEDFEVVANLSWVPSSDPYFVPPEAYEITVIRDGEESEPILVVGNTARNIKLIGFANSDGVIEYESVKAVTRYIFIIKTVDEEGARSNGVIVDSESPIFNPPAAPSNFRAVEQGDGDLFVSWRNSVSPYLDYNTIRIEQTISGSTTEFLAETPIGKALTYEIDNSSLTDGATYTLYLTAYDRYDNSSSVTTSITLADGSNLGRPGVPENQFASSGDGVIVLRWDSMDTDLITHYKIWRSDGDLSISVSSFSLLNTIDSDYQEYRDFTIEDDKRYYYFVTSVDSFGQESLNPVDDGFISYPYSFGKSTISNALGSVAISSVVQAGHDAVISWNVVAGDFDGYEIHRSVGNNYEFSLIGYAAKSATSYTDEDALLVGGTTYYYLVRRYRNEAEILVTESSTEPQGSIFIGEITTSAGSITIDQEDVNELLNMRDPIITETRIQVNAHKHTIDSVSGIDRRIDLSSNIIVTDWTTTDYKTYTTTEDITGASGFILNVSGSANLEFFKDEEGVLDKSVVAQVENGLPPVLFEITSSGSITFESPLYDDTETLDEETPYSSEPALSLTLVDVSEVTGSVPPSRVSSFSATQVDTGEFDTRQLPSLDHEGRIGETLIPNQQGTYTDDRFTYLPNATVVTTTDEDGNETQELQAFRLKDSITFYDVLEISSFKTPTAVPGDVETAASENSALLAATSKGIMVSTDFGSSWVYKFSGLTAPSRLFYSSTMDKYFAFSNRRVWVSSGELNDWSPMAGVENVNAIRDVIEDNSGNMYISTDLGVYKLDVSTITRFFNWDQTPLFGPRSTESYALLYDSSEDRLIVSNELGILESTTSGRSWSFTDEFSQNKKIWSFVQSQNRIFALTDDAIYRKASGSFSLIAEIDADTSRRLTLFNDRLYFLTDEGIMATARGADIYNDSGITTSPVFPDLNLNGNRVPATSLNTIGNLMLIGTDQRMFFVNASGRVSIQFDKLVGKIPSVYVDKVLQKMGFRYSNADNEDQAHSISFDEKQDVDAVVKVARQYDKFTAQNGGWAFQKFDARTRIYANKKPIVDTGDEEITITADNFTDFVFPEFEEADSHFSLATTYQTDAENKISALDVYFGAEAEEDAAFSFDEDAEQSSVVRDTLLSIEKFFSMLYPSARKITEQVETEDEDGNVTVTDGAIVDATLPDVSYSFTGVDVVGAETRTLPTDPSSSADELISFVNQISGPGNVSSVTASGQVAQADGTVTSDEAGVSAAINTTTGEVTLNTEYDKYDNMQIDIYGVTLSGIGDLTHQEAEDGMELVNSGLWSAFSQAMQANVVKVGIFNEKKFPGEQETRGIPVQAKYIVPRNYGFYDKLNSTVDYSLEIYSNTIGLSLPYASALIEKGGYIFVGGFGGALKIDAGNLSIEEIQDSEIQGQNIKQFLSVQDTLYAVSEKNVIYSTDGGSSWTNDIRAGLPNNLYAIGYISGSLVVGGDDGIYFKARQMDAWEKVVDSENPVEIIINPNLLFAVVDGSLYYATNGANFIDGGSFPVTPYKIAKFKSMMYTASDAGLYEDNGTFYSGNFGLALIDLLGDTVESKKLIVNDISADSDNMVVALSDGNMYKFTSSGFEIMDTTSLDTIQKVLVYNGEAWAFAYDRFVVVNISNETPRTTYPIRLSTGAPL